MNFCYFESSGVNGELDSISCSSWSKIVHSCLQTLELPKNKVKLWSANSWPRIPQLYVKNNVNQQGNRIENIKQLNPNVHLNIHNNTPWTMHGNAKKSVFRSWVDQCEYLSFGSDLCSILDQQPYLPMSFV